MSKRTALHTVRPEKRLQGSCRTLVEQKVIYNSQAYSYLHQNSFLQPERDFPLFVCEIVVSGNALGSGDVPFSLLLVLAYGAKGDRIF
jgi:hypothetical protein